MKVVIIDDDKSSGKALADLLETKYDMEVLGCALCGLDGLAMVNRYQPDVLFLDVRGHKTKRIFKREPENDGRT